MLSEKQQKCITLMVSSDKTQRQIAKEIQVNENTITDWKKNKEFQSELQKQMQENFGSLAVTAQKELGKLLKNKNAYVRLQAIKDVLDRAGYGAINKIDIDIKEKEEKKNAITDILNQMKNVDDA